MSTLPTNLKVSTRAMYKEFLRQEIPVRIVDAETSLLEFTDNAGEKRLLFSTSSDRSSEVGLSISRNKLRSEIVAKELGIPVPLDTICNSLSDAQEFFLKHAPIVLKPLDNSGGSGVSTNINDQATLEKAYSYAREYGDRVIAQKHIDGKDIRLLVIAGTFRSALERRPAHVTGDGVSTTLKLIIDENNSDQRSDGRMGSLDLISMSSAELYLGEKITKIPALGEMTQVVGPANLSLGGTAREATASVTPAMIADAEKITRKLKLGICGVDMMWNSETGKYFMIEVNAIPAINMHNEPRWGTSSDAIVHYVKWLAEPLPNYSTL